MTEPAGANGRSTDGKFGRGNSFGKGNPIARYAQKLRQLFVEAVTEQDIRDIVSKLVTMAKSGDIAAANLLLTRALGKPAVADNVANVDEAPEPLGPVTAENLEEHKRRMIEELEDGTFDVERERAIRRARLVSGGT
jgi:hypothetical protein